MHNRMILPYRQDMPVPDILDMTWSPIRWICMTFLGPIPRRLRPGRQHGQVYGRCKYPGPTLISGQQKRLGLLVSNFSSTIIFHKIFPLSRDIQKGRGTYMLRRPRSRMPNPPNSFFYPLLKGNWLSGTFVISLVIHQIWKYIRTIQLGRQNNNIVLQYNLM